MTSYSSCSTFFEICICGNINSNNINTDESSEQVHTPTHTLICKEMLGRSQRDEARCRGQEGRQSFRATSYYLCGSQPNSHRATGKVFPEESRNAWLFIPQMNAAHTNRGTQLSDNTFKRAAYDGGYSGGIFQVHCMRC